MKPIFDCDVNFAGRMAAAFMAIELIALGWPTRRSDSTVAAQFGVSPATVSRWRRLAVYRDEPEYWRVAFRSPLAKAGAAK